MARVAYDSFEKNLAYIPKKSYHLLTFDERHLHLVTILL